MVKGHRIFPNKFGFLRLPEGGFGQDIHGKWWIRPSGSNARIIAQHDVMTMPDETITVSGYIAQGVWT